MHKNCVTASACTKTVLQHQHAQKLHHDKTCKEREFSVNDNVYVRNYGRGEKWVPGDIVQSTGPVSYKVKTNEGSVVRRHADQVRVTCGEHESESVTSPRSDRLTQSVESCPEAVIVETSDPTTVVAENRVLPEICTSHHSESEMANGPRVESPNQQPLRRSSRAIKAPDKLDL
ncbi:hypothetical protein ElyMa_006844700 [Elysia marginata]|uniref:Uncharacterized protein n=1 Tax=Elysia marginata TaxID=1093978 RepID=A0AAV4J9I8_9GAST|nr:hypothetical protein ElyMa_006844700 [Elysia marginata]